MDCFGTYFTHAQTCVNVRVQSATQWTASVHTFHLACKKWKVSLKRPVAPLQLKCFKSDNSDESLKNCMFLPAANDLLARRATSRGWAFFLDTIFFWVGLCESQN